MLGKLLKYDIKAQMKIALPTFGIALILVCTSKITMLMGWLESDKIYLQLPSAFLMIISMLALFATAFIAYIGIILRFYNNLLGDSGYLMFTLPVSPTELLLSKLISGILWMISTVIVFILSLGFLFGNDFWETFTDGASMGLPAGMSSFLFLLLALAVIFGMVFGILLLYLSMSVGPHILSNRLAGSIIAYIAITFGLQIIMLVTLMASALFAAGSGMMDSLINTSPATVAAVMLGIVLAGEIIISFVTFMITRHFLGKKLNLA